MLVVVRSIEGQALVAAPAPMEAGKRSMAGVMVVVAILFFISGFLSIYTRQCADRRPRTRRVDLPLPLGVRPHNNTATEPRGLNHDVIESFPTFAYADVKRLMVAKEALACAVCLDEFQDDETLRLIPVCNHVFHPGCIDPWLASNSTCPVCRANLVPTSEVEVEQEEPLPLAAVEIPQQEQDLQQNDEDDESPKENMLGRIRSSLRSRSTGFLFGLLFPRSDSRSGAASVERCVRLPEEVRRKLLLGKSSRLKRARSCVSLGRMGSGRSGYRTRSGVGIIGIGIGRYERFHAEDDHWDLPLFTNTPPFLHDVHPTTSSAPPILPSSHNTP